MKNVLAQAQVIVCVGSGGVGKTTVASAIALRAAQMGRRVLVLTVDPAKRLKSTMGLDNQDEAQIQHPSIKGSLSASVIDPKKIFDQFVTRVSGNSERTHRILNNKLYVQMSTTLSGSQEFTALEKLYASHESGKYDLIVLDTPPTKHAIDFLQAPQKLSILFSEKITKWFRDPDEKEKGFFRSLIQTGTQQVLRALESLTGSEFMRELADFFLSIQQWQGKLEKRIGEVHKLLVNPKTHFLLVTSFDEAKLQEAEFFSKEIRKSGYQLSGVLINRAYPKGLDLSVQTLGKSELENLYAKFQGYIRDRERVFQSFSIRMSGQGQVLKLPELMNPISDLEGVLEMAQNMEEAEGSSK